MSTSREAKVYSSDQVEKGVASSAFGISVAFVVVLAILVVVLMVLYFRRDKSLIKPSQCPEKVNGLLVKSDMGLTQVASNCGSQVDCTFQVASVQDGVNLCTSLGPSKCASFSLTQVQNSDLYTMKVSDATTTSVSVGTDTYRILQ